MKLARAILVGSVFAFGASTSAPADACENEVFRQLTPVQEIALAEKDLEHGRFRGAAYRVRGQFANVRALDAKAPPLAQRALRIYALVLVRTDGRFDAGLGWTRWGNLEWAVETLADLDAHRPNDARSQADLAEARTHLGRTREAGLRVLEDLDRRDLLGSPFSYLALARARKASGDEGGAIAAMRRCAMMSVDRARCPTDLADADTKDRG